MSGILITENKYTIYSDVTLSGTYTDPVILYENGVYKVSDGARQIKIKSISDKYHKVIVTDNDSRKVYGVHGPFTRKGMKYREKKRSSISYDCYRHIISFLGEQNIGTHEHTVLTELLSDPLHFVIERIEAIEGSFHPMMVERYMGKYASEWNRVCMNSFITFARSHPSLLEEIIRRMRVQEKLGES